MVDAALTLRPPLIEGNKSIAQVTHDVCAPMEARPTGLWWGALAVSSSLLLLGVVAIAYQIAVGVGTWELNPTVEWFFVFINNVTATTDIHTLSLHDAIPIQRVVEGPFGEDPGYLGPQR